MKAFQLVAQGKPGRFELRDVPDAKPDADEVLVQVHACGLNHLDLWLEEGGLPIPIQLPRTPGGEAAGVIEEVGPDITDFKPGDRVAVQSNLFCGKCEFCRSGEESMCLFGQLLGVQIDGGFAEKVVVPSRNVLRLPENVSFETSAALTLAGSTAMHMLTNRTRVKPNDWVLVMGASSGVGSAAIQIAKQLGAKVITTASSEAKKKLGEKLGADFVLDSEDTNWPAEVRKITSKRGANVVIEHIGGEVLKKCFECLARGGTIVTCGATAGREVELNLWPLFVKQQRLIGSYGRNRWDMEETLRWADAGKLKPVIDSVFSLAEAEKGFASLRARTVLGKVLINPQT